MGEERLGEMLRRLGEVMRIAHDRGLVNLLGGNASIRWGDGFYITPSQVPKNQLRPEDMVYVPFDLGPELSLSGKKASMEWRMHREIYLNNPEVNAVLHTHNPYTLALYMSGLEVNPKEFVEAYTIGECISLVPFLPAGSVELARSVAEALKSCKVAVLLNHGVVAGAKNLSIALDSVEALEDLSRITIMRNLLSKLSRIGGWFP